MNTANVLSVKVNKTDKKVETIVSYFVQDLGRNRDETITEIPHKDFYDALFELNNYLAEMFFCKEDNISNYEASGFKWAKDGVVVITGKVITPNNLVKGISSPSINLNKDIFGWEDDLEQSIEMFSNEVILLLENQKKALTQKTIDDAVEDNKAAEDNEEGDKATNEFDDLISEKYAKPSPENEEFEKQEAKE